MISFGEYAQFIFEGGNIKGPNGETSNPISTKNRSKVANDVSSSLSILHKSFHAATGHHLFGRNEKALQTGSAFSGSSSHLVNPNISDEELHKHKPSMGDIDTQIPKKHLAELHAHLHPGKVFGKYTVVGSKKHGVETSILAKHKDTGEHHQIDFEGVDYHKDEPTKYESFAHSSPWEDTKRGIKGASHKQLLNAAGGEEHKFSSTHGLKSRTDETVPAKKNPEEISKTLFGKDADHSKIHTFHGVTQLIKKHIHPSKHEAIIKKFAERGDVTAVKHLRHELDTPITEAITAGHHAAVVPLVGFSPVSHMGHVKDLGGAMNKTGASVKLIGMSKKAAHFSPMERKDIWNKQSGGDIKAHVVSGAGETIRKAYDALPNDGKPKHLHLVYGHDRKDVAYGVKKALDTGKIKEMGDMRFDHVHVHFPEDNVRSHGFSGTKMRQAAHEKDEPTLKAHLGGAYSKDISDKIKVGIRAGHIPLKRK